MGQVGPGMLHSLRRDNLRRPRCDMGQLKRGNRYHPFREERLDHLWMSQVYCGGQLGPGIRRHHFRAGISLDVSSVMWRQLGPGIRHYWREDNLRCSWMSLI